MHRNLLFSTCIVVWEQSREQIRSVERKKQLEQLERVSDRVIDLEHRVVEAAAEVKYLKGVIQQNAAADAQITEQKQMNIINSDTQQHEKLVQLSENTPDINERVKSVELKPVEFQKPVENVLIESQTEEMCPLIPTSEVDIDMTELYETDPFEDPNLPGAWKQGFPINPDLTKHITVHILPHSHNDPGWIKTFDQYFTTQTKPILTTIIEGLSKDPRRKFIWAEIIYFSKWWNEASVELKNKARNVINNKQLEFVTSGWVMPDEANTHWYSLIDQLNLGNNWVDNVLGESIVRESSWAIDPFGHSSVYAWILNRSGMKNALIQRTHYVVKRNLAKRKNLEFKWRQEFDSEAKQEIVTHMMPFYSYDVPHTCGPDPKVCCQFDFARMKPISKFTCPWKVAPKSIITQNVEERAKTIISQWRQKEDIYNKGHVLIPLGDDFRYQKADEFEAQFSNFQKLMDFINSSPELKVTVKFSTLSEYFAAIPNKEDFPSLQGDFFTYADRGDNYWSGYFSTRPYYKNFERLLANKIYSSSLLKFMHSLDQTENITQDQESLYKISKARAELGIFQHHDGITGTARSSVVEDYGKRMKYAEGLTKEVSEQFMAKLAGVDRVSYQDYQHEASIENVIDMSMKSEVHIIFQNQNVENSENLLEVFVNKPDVRVFDKHGKECIGQTEFRHGTVYRLVFKPNDKLSSLGFDTFTMTRGNNEGIGLTMATDSKTEISGKVGDFAHFDKESGGLTFTHNSETVKIDVLAYLSDVKRKEKEGAYLFLPAGKAQPFQASNTAELKVQTGPLRTIFTVKREESVEYDLIISDDSINLQTRTYLNDKHNNKNICLRFTINGLENNGIYTDMNGINFNYRKRFDFSKIPLQGQFYPMPAVAYISNNANKNFGVVSQQPLAVASLEKGQIDVILDRRLAQDDNRGLGQPIKDNRFSVLNFKLLANAKPNPGGESNIFEAELLKSSTKILRPPVRFISQNKPSVMSKSLVDENKSNLFKNCELELGGVFLPSYFDEYEKNSFGSSKVNVLLRSYKSRSSCENECGYEKLEFLKLFSGSGKNFKMKAVNLLGKTFREDSGVVDTSPLQAYLLE